MQEQNLWELLADVGWTMVPIYVCSVFVVMLTVRKLIDFTTARLQDMRWLEGVVTQLEQHDLDAAQRLAQDTPHPAGRVAAAFIKARAEKPAQADAEAQRAGLEAIAGLLERHDETARSLQLTAVIREARRSVLGELDFRRELRHLTHRAVACGAAI